MRWVMVATLLAGCSGCESTPSRSSCELVRDGWGPAGTTSVRAEKVVDGLEVPWGIAFLPGGGDFLVTERPGRVRLVSDGVLVPEPVATLPVSKSSEAGLLGIALHPELAKNRQLYLYVTVDQAGGMANRVERWKLSGDGRSATRDRVILDGIRGAPFHDGGRLRFGPDGMLYVATGDARVPALSRDPKSLNGKILRLTPEGGVPADNPRPGSPAFILGLRNPQGFDWLDPKTLLVTDHGPSGELGRTGHDEINVARSGDDLGWPTLDGCETRPGLVTPRLTWRTAVPPAGAAVYSGNAIAAWKGSLLVGTLRSRHLHRVAFDGSGRMTGHEVYFEGKYGRIRDVVMGPDGYLYFTTSNCDGRGPCGPAKDQVLRIVPGP